MSNESEDKDLLNTNVIEQLNSKLGTILDDLYEENPDSNYGLEILSVLLSIASQVAIDLNIDNQGFSKLTNQFFKEVDKMAYEDQINSKLFGQHKDVKEEKPN